jgi:acetyl-CoA C-acetyltransferase
MGDDVRDDTDQPGLMREAIDDCLEDVETELEDLDAIVVGNAGEFFTGINTPDLHAIFDVGADGAPEMRIHTGGTAGASTGLAAFYHVASGLYDEVLCVAFEKLGDTNQQAALSTVYHPIFGREFAAGAPAAAGAQATRWIARNDLDRDETERQAAEIAVKQREMAQKNPYAQLQLDLTVDDVLDSPILASPVKFMDTCPSTDGACAMLMAPDDQARDLAPQPAWITGVGAISDGVNQPGRDWGKPEACAKAGRKAYEMAGVDDPYNEFDVLELYDAFSFQEMIWHEALDFAETGEGGTLVDEGVTNFHGELPTCPSGGVLCNNPIGATAMTRQAEAARQVMGTAGDHQIPDVSKSMGHGWGGAIQFFTCMIFEDTPQGVTR